MQRALLIVNPGSRFGGDNAERAEQLLTNAGFAVERPDASDPSRYAEIVRANRDAVDFVVVGGGDGSLHLALPGLIDAGLTLGILPLGTANNFARNLGIPIDLAAACAVIAKAKTSRVDVASVNGNYFLNASGLGLSSAINREISKELKRRFGMFAYVILAFRLARRMRPFRVEIACDHRAPVATRALQVTISNGRFYGAGVPVAPGATLEDGLLDLCSTEVDAWWKAVRNLPALLRGDPNKAPDVRWLVGTTIELRTRRPRHIDADGEIVTMSPATFRVHPKRLTVFVPP